MKEKSVSRVAEERREKDHESNRKKSSTVKAVGSKPSDHFTRQDVHNSVRSVDFVGPNVGDEVTQPKSKRRVALPHANEGRTAAERRQETEKVFSSLRKASSDNK